MVFVPEGYRGGLDISREVQSMPSDGTRNRSTRELSGSVGGSTHASFGARARPPSELSDPRTRLSRLARTLESSVIPELVDSHRSVDGSRSRIEQREVQAFTTLVATGSDARLAATVAAWHRRGIPVETLFMDLFAPAARHLGELWEQDRCNFTVVTVGVGRLQALMREWSDTLGARIAAPADGQRIVLAQHPEEQHSFGLSMVAEFFRRDGWTVHGGVGRAVTDLPAEVARAWFDAVGVSVGSEKRVEWARDTIARLRSTSRNPSIIVLAGGPLLGFEPRWAETIGADASGHDGATITLLATQLIDSRVLHN
ncbi:MAG: cobalamin B12-binding domain-containing protein [Burkholderiales bacterium]|nr:cobalamin B12-binding domain-containing protein [Burkholderiales bacterium]